MPNFQNINNGNKNFAWIHLLDKVFDRYRR